MYLWKFTLSFFSCTTIFLNGCCTSTVKFDPKQCANIKTIGILTIDEAPQGYTCYDQESVMSSPANTGIIGSMIGSAFAKETPAAKSAKLKVILDNNSFNFPKEFYDNLVTELADVGYKVIPVNVTRAKYNFVKDYNTITESSVDAYLDIIVEDIGCTQNFNKNLFNSPYYPWLGVNARLVQAGSGKVLYSSSSYYAYAKHSRGCIFIGCGRFEIKPDANYIFKTFDTLTNDPHKYTQSMRIAVKKVAEQIAIELIKPTDYK